MPTVLIDPVVTAEKTLSSNRGWSMVSVAELKAMAGYILYLEGLLELNGEVRPQYHGLAIEALPVEPSALDPDRVLALIKNVNRTFDAFESARLSARERGARGEFKGALKALADCFEMEICNVEPN